MTDAPASVRRDSKMCGVADRSPVGVYTILSGVSWRSWSRDVARKDAVEVLQRGAVDVAVVGPGAGLVGSCHDLECAVDQGVGGVIDEVTRVGEGASVGACGQLGDRDVL